MPLYISICIDFTMSLCDFPATARLSCWCLSAVEGCTVMGIVGIPRYPRVYRGNGVEHGGNTPGMELDIAVTPGGWN